MKLGINLLLFGDTVTDAVREQFAKIRDVGFDGIEVPVFDPAAVDTEGIRGAAEKYGLEITTSGALPPGTRFYGTEAAPRKKAEAYVHDAIGVAVALGAPVICGPLYKAVGDCDLSMPLEQQRRETADAMKPLAEEAAAAGVTLAFEPLNRFETNLLNTVDQGIAFCERIASPGAGLLLDTFHMHIEEKSSGKAIHRARRAGVLAHFHASENDRGIPGSGQVDWEGVSRSLWRPKYTGWVVLESFNQANEAIKTAVSCWRPFYPSEKTFMDNGLRFVSNTFLG